MTYFFSLAFTVLGTVLLWNELAFAIAIYDYSVSVTLSFNQPWISATSGISPTTVNTSGTGLHQESTSFLPVADLSNLLYSRRSKLLEALATRN